MLSHPPTSPTPSTSALWSQRLHAGLQQRKDNHRWRQRINLNSPQGIHLQVQGQTLLNFSSNDYLGLAQNQAALIEGVKRWGMGSGASHLVCGHSQAHDDLEQALATATGYPRALLFANGYMANVAVLSTLLTRHDVLLQDKLNHASLIDGGQLCAAKVQRYRHNDAHHLGVRLSALNKNERSDDPSTGGIMVATDAVFSMDGDQAPLAEIAALCHTHQALLMVDDAHGFGLLGSHQHTGSVAHQGLKADDVPIYMGTLGKGLGGYGAFIAGSEALIEYLIQFARPYIYTTALPAALAHAMHSNLDEVMGGERQRVLNQRIDYFRRRAHDLDLNLMPSDTAIQPLLITHSQAQDAADNDAKALALSEALKAQGLLVTAIRPPTVAVGSARLRITLSAAHRESDIDRLLDALATLIADDD